MSRAPRFLFLNCDQAGIFRKDERMSVIKPHLFIRFGSRRWPSGFDAKESRIYDYTSSPFLDDSRTVTRMMTDVQPFGSLLLNSTEANHMPKMIN